MGLVQTRQCEAVVDNGSRCQSRVARWGNAATKTRPPFSCFIPLLARGAAALIPIASPLAATLQGSVATAVNRGRDTSIP